MYLKYIDVKAFQKIYIFQNLLFALSSVQKTSFCMKKNTKMGKGRIKRKEKCNNCHINGAYIFKLHSRVKKKVHFPNLTNCLFLYAP